MKRSKRLTKKERKEKKERKSIIGLGGSVIEGDVVVTGMSSPDAPVTHLFGKDGKPVVWKSGSVAVAYNRKGKDKITSWWPFSGTDIQENPTRAMMQFDRVVAIDTNTNGGVSVTASVSVVPSSIDFKDGEYPPVSVSFGTPLEFRGAQRSPERIGWYECVKAWLETPEYLNGARLAVVVDHDLERLKGINEGREPFFENLMLPERVTMVYASSGHDRNMLPNMLISLADKHATHIINKRSSFSSNPWQAGPAGKLFAEFRRWSAEDQPENGNMSTS